MPNYLYECPNCGQIEHFKRMTEADLEACPNCGEEVKRVYSVPSVHYKGSGFASTDDGLERDSRGRIKEAMPDTPI